MAINQNLIRQASDRGLFTATAVAFPLLILIGYFKSYYFRAFFDVQPIVNSLVHAHGVVMTVWVGYFVAQIALIRTKNVKLHMTFGLAGIALAALVVIVGLLTSYDSHVTRMTAPPGMNPHGFFFIGVADMLLFIIFFGAAILYRRRPTEHKTLMLMTAINFLPAAVVRIPLISPKLMILWAYGVPDLLAVICLLWMAYKQRKINLVFAAAVLLLIVSQPLRIMFAGSKVWLDFVARLAG